MSGASGGVGTVAVPPARRAAWLQAHGVEPVPHGDALKERLLAATGGRIGALIDTFGQGYEAPAVDLGVPAARIGTVINFAAAAESGVTPEGNAVGG